MVAGDKVGLRDVVDSVGDRAPVVREVAGGAVVLDVPEAVVAVTAAVVDGAVPDREEDDGAVVVLVKVAVDITPVADTEVVVGDVAVPGTADVVGSTDAFGTVVVDAEFGGSEFVDASIVDAEFVEVTVSSAALVVSATVGKGPEVVLGADGLDEAVVVAMNAVDAVARVEDTSTDEVVVTVGGVPVDTEEVVTFVCFSVVEPAVEVGPNVAPDNGVTAVVAN